MVGLRTGGIRLRDARSGRRRGPPTGIVSSLVLGLFGTWSKKRDSKPEIKIRESPKLRIVLEGMQRELDLPKPSAPPPVADPLRHELRYHALHGDVNPSSSVRPAEMTCPGCDRHFRYFLNANGTKTVVSCPGCGRQFRL